MYSLKYNTPLSEVTELFLSDEALSEQSLFDEELQQLQKFRVLNWDGAVIHSIYKHDTLIGLLKHELFSPDTCVMHLYILSPYQGLGISTELKTVIVDYFTNETSYRKAFVISPENCAHVTHAVHKVGFQFEGIFKELAIWRGNVSDFNIFGYTFNRTKQ